MQRLRKKNTLHDFRNLVCSEKQEKHHWAYKYMYNEDKASGKVKEKQRNTPRLIKEISFLKGNI